MRKENTKGEKKSHCFSERTSSTETMFKSSVPKAHRKCSKHRQCRDCQGLLSLSPAVRSTGLFLLWTHSDVYCKVYAAPSCCSYSLDDSTVGLISYCSSFDSRHQSFLNADMLKSPPLSPKCRAAQFFFSPGAPDILLVSTCLRSRLLLSLSHKHTTNVEVKSLWHIGLSAIEKIQTCVQNVV